MDLRLQILEEDSNPLSLNLNFTQDSMTLQLLTAIMKKKNREVAHSKKTYHYS